MEYSEKNRTLRDRLLNFRAELEALKLEDRQTVHDQVYDTNLKSGIDKYSSLRKVEIFEWVESFLDKFFWVFSKIYLAG